MSYNISTKSILKAVLLLFIFWVFFAGIYFAKPFLLPLAYAAIFSMLLWPITRKMESWGINQKLACLLAVLLLVAVVVGVFSLLSNQIQGFAKDLPELKQTFMEKLQDAQEYVSDKFGVTEERQEQVLNESKSGATSMGKQFATSLLNTFAQSLLMLVYIFLLLLYRSRFKDFILKYTAEEKRDKAHEVILRSAHVAKSYLSGRLLLMVILAVAYCVGLTLIGVEQAIFFGSLAAILGIIPFVGNIIGAILPLVMALINQGSTAALWVVVLFTIVQLIENYLLEPLVVGKKVDLNGFFAIAVVVLGELVWGISGAILAMPFLGIAKIIFDNIRPLKPIGFLIGEEDDDHNEKDGEDLGDKIINKAKSLIGKNH